MELQTRTQRELRTQRAPQPTQRATPTLRGWVLGACAVVGLAVVASAQGKLPAGWQTRLDDGSTQPTGIQFMTMGTGVHVMSGPAAIFYKPEMTKSGTYQAQATFQLMEPAAHAEAYGLFIGGSDLAAATQKYTYFLVRQGGMFLVERGA